MSKKDINKEAEKQGRRNDDALKFIRVIDRILLINNDKRELTEAEKKRVMGDWLETPEGLKKNYGRLLLSLMLSNAVLEILYRMKFWKLYIFGFIALFGGGVLWAVTGIKFIFIIGAVIIGYSLLEGLIVGNLTIQDTYTNSVVKYSRPDYVIDMINRSKELKEHNMQLRDEIFANYDAPKSVKYRPIMYQNLSSEEAKKVYKNLVRMYHPDNNKNQHAAEALDEIKKEYEEYAEYTKWMEDHGYELFASFPEPQHYEDIENMM